MDTKSPVFIVGAGPGDPELLTVKATRLIKEADVVVYDRLVSEEILDLIPKGTTRIFAGKARANHHMPQEEINELLVKLSRGGRRTVRLKGGDPFIFGRGGEEAIHLANNQVPFEIIPGITASTSCTAYAGIPLTHRGLALGVHFVTGHCQGQAEQELELNWQCLADPDTTLVIYMGLVNSRTISSQLIAHGLPANHPAAAIQSGTTPQQKTVVTTLADLPDAIARAELRAPTLLVIGKVVELAEVLDWFRPTDNDSHLEAHG